jgi:hypothetical protein
VWRGACGGAKPCRLAGAPEGTTATYASEQTRWVGARGVAKPLPGTDTPCRIVTFGRGGGLRVGLIIQDVAENSGWGGTPLVSQCHPGGKQPLCGALLPVRVVPPSIPVPRLDYINLIYLTLCLDRLGFIGCRSRWPRGLIVGLRPLGCRDH